MVQVVYELLMVFFLVCVCVWGGGGGGLIFRGLPFRGKSVWGGTTLKFGFSR